MSAPGYPANPGQGHTGFQQGGRPVHPPQGQPGSFSSQQIGVAPPMANSAAMAGPPMYAGPGVTAVRQPMAGAQVHGHTSPAGPPLSGPTVSQGNPLPGQGAHLMGQGGHPPPGQGSIPHTQTGPVPPGSTGTQPPSVWHAQPNAQSGGVRPTGPTSQSMSGPTGQFPGPGANMTGPPGGMTRGGVGAPPMPNNPGLSGPPGHPGMAAPPGHPGMAAPPGHLGATGSPGYPGAAGLPGHPGAAGPPGHPGMAARPGPPGASGPPGHPAASGPPGHPGMAARPGPPGASGPPGHPTASGPPGHPGASGPPGHPGVASPPSHAGPGAQLMSQHRGQTAPPSLQGQPGAGGFPGQGGPPPPSIYGAGPPGTAPTHPGVAPGPGMQGLQPGYGAPGMQPPNPSVENVPPRVTPESTPHPLAVWQADKELYRDQAFYTSQRGIIPPLPTTVCDIVDQGNTSSRFLRTTLYNVPASQDILHKSNIPLGLVIQPMAQLPPKEDNIFVVNHGEKGPLRCRRCKGYISPHATFIDGGRKFACNLCQFQNDVPDDYQCQLDHNGLRLDVNERPELSCGSVEFIATNDYCKDGKWPDPPAYIFLVETTYQSVSCGLMALMCRMLRVVLDELPKDVGQEKTKVRIGIATFDSTIHFYNLKASLVQPQMVVVPDVSDVFVPLLDGFLVDAEESSLLIDMVLEEIPRLYSNTRETSSCLGPAIQASMEALKTAGCPGKIFVFSASMPKADVPGALKNREDRALFRTDKEKNLYTPQVPFYPNLGAECVKYGACIEMFCCSTAGYVDMPTMTSMVTPTGGEVHHYPFFTYQGDGERLIRDLRHSVSRQTGFDSVMRVRCSTGLRATDFWGNIHMLNTTDVLMGGIDCDKAIGVEVKYDDKLGDEGTLAYYQVALLYTSVGGQRRLRIHNLAVPCTKQLSEVYRCADMDSIMNLFLKKAVRKLHETSYKNMRQHLLEQSIALLSCYRKDVSEPASGARLILPEALKLLPLYVCSLLKSEAMCALSDTRIDDKAWLMHQVSSMTVASSMAYLYPTVMPLHNLSPDRDVLPAPCRCYYQELSQEGAYILENGVVLMLWLGSRLHPGWVKEVFGVHTLAEINPDKLAKLPVLDNPTSTLIRGIISRVLNSRVRSMKMVIIIQGGQKEVLLRRLLCEDGSGDGGPSYMDLLCHMHKEIRNTLK